VWFSGFIIGIMFIIVGVEINPGKQIEKAGTLIGHAKTQREGG
jgi:hypothetical protein